MIRTIDQSFSASYGYPVHFTRGGDVLSSIVGEAKSLFVVDSNVAGLHPIIRADLVIPGGEICKNEPSVLTRIYEAIARAGLCRHSYVVAVGGGAVLDVVGYAAATAHRGLRLIRMPTTVLSQNDSGVGVKNSINAMGKKNFLGTFAPPFGVINDETFLATLSDRDWRAGISEAVKVALIKDAGFFDWIETNASALVSRDASAMREMIFRCAQLHLAHIAKGGDPFESGSSRPLDFGHWAAHKIEELSGYEVRHGEAVAIGIAIDARYSQRIGLLGSADRITTLLDALQLPTSASQDAESVLAGLEDFRQHLGGRLTITLLQDIGRGTEVHEIDRGLMRECIKHFT